MNDEARASFEGRLRAALTDRARSVSAPADAGAMASVAQRARQRHSRRRWGAASLTSALVLAVGLSVVVAAGGGGPRQTASHGGSPGGHGLDRHNGVLVLALSGTVNASQPGDGVSNSGATYGLTPRRGIKGSSLPSAASGSAQTASGTTSPGASALGASSPSPSTTAPSTTGPIDVAPSSPTPLQRLFGHTSPDGVQMTAFDQPAGATSPAPAFNGGGPVSSPPVESGCLTTTQLTLEVSDTAAVGTASEPLFQGATGALVDVQVGEIGDAEGAPATWVLAQAGEGAASVEVQFADGQLDRATVGSSGVAVLGHKGTAAAALGDGSVAAIDVLGSGGQVLAGYGLGTGSAVAAGPAAPSALPAPGGTQPADPTAATAAVTRAVETALGCRASPLQRLQVVAGGDVLETAPYGGSAMVNVDKVVFTSATAAVVQYQLNGGQGAQDTGRLYADATLGSNGWQLSLASVAPEVQVTPANQVGNVTVAPGGPLFVKSWPGGTAVAVYKALPGSQAAAGYGTGDAVCTPAGGVVDEVTTPGAVGVLTGALFPNYASPLIGAAVSSVGSGEGSPATVVGVEVGPQVTSLAVTGTAGTVTEAPVNGVAVVVLAGDAPHALGAAGSQLEVTDSTGAGLATVSLQVEATAPAGPSSLPSTLPAVTPAGPGPADPQAATRAITAAFASVFDCNTPPIQRVQSVQDGSLVAGALEQLATGPYEALVSSSYIDVNNVVFESPTLADVAYTIRFHSDAQLTFPMIGQALIIDGGWRVSYATVCAAIQLGLGNCQA